MSYNLRSNKPQSESSSVYVKPDNTRHPKLTTDSQYSLHQQQELTHTMPQFSQDLCVALAGTVACSELTRRELSIN